MVTDASGAPRRGVDVDVSGSAAADYSGQFPIDFGPGPHDDAVTDAQGHYTIDGVATGPQRVCAEDPDTGGRRCLAGRTIVSADRVSTAPTLRLATDGKRNRTGDSVRSQPRLVLTPGHSVAADRALLLGFPQLRGFGTGPWSPWRVLRSAVRSLPGVRCGSVARAALDAIPTIRHARPC